MPGPVAQFNHRSLQRYPTANPIRWRHHTKAEASHLKLVSQTTIPLARQTYTLQPEYSTQILTNLEPYSQICHHTTSFLARVQVTILAEESITLEVGLQELPFVAVSLSLLRNLVTKYVASIDTIEVLLEIWCLLLDDGEPYPTWNFHAAKMWREDRG